jgi:hypothetical protein
MLWGLVMNPDVLDIYNLTFGPYGRCDVEAVVEDAVLVRSQTLEDPPEWGPALCRGTFYLCEDDVIPATDAGVKRLLSERIDDWEVVDLSDWADDG